MKSTKQQQKGESVYHQIAEKLIADIQAGDYLPGDRLPSENELAAHYGVHRFTARMAIKYVVDQDLVYRIQGRGAFVKEQKIDYSLNFKTNFTQSLLNLGYLPCIRILSSKLITASEQLANLLETNIGNSLFQVKFLRVASLAMTDTTVPEWNPLCISVSYLLSEKFPDLPILIYKSQSLYSLLRNHYGIEPRRTRTQIETQAAYKEEAKLLKIPPGAPMLITKSQVRDQHDHLFEYTVTHFRGDRFTFEVSCSLQLTT
ncbi:phosphonate metabolism transcriptional regulator PhnF [Nostoc sp. CHAB 5715]|uniref:phosphonate metabolism transcriptional regulator PhnF n=1 Tax=Nostoc sp. CHAB 5715 TaxID=2780400 RepID=UPI001E59B84D|nr:phosphonate metabolism transcriptional regulator PhnF [Nostoc sp. CHAB 5715]MCC5621927.1 phosphonate metabolism transcriptional regulator PhnF [Nostoc sp. CHAB 5715]